MRRIPQHLLDILSKIVSLHVKLAIKCIQTSKKEKFHKQSAVIWFKKDCSVRHMFYKIVVSLSVTKILAKHIRSSSYLLWLFFKENSHLHENLLKGLFLLQFLYIKYFEQIFLETPICSWWKKNQQNLSIKIKTWW